MQFIDLTNEQFMIHKTNEQMILMPMSKHRDERYETNDFNI